MEKSKAKSLILLLVSLLIPVTILLIVVRSNSVNVPYADEWAIVPVFQKIDRGEFVLGELWKPWNEHRMFFPKLVITISAYLTNWNIRTESLINVGLGIVIAATIYLIIQKNIKHPLLSLLAMFITSFWLFSPIQSENWLWGWDIVWFLSTAAAVAVIYLLSSLKAGQHYSRLAGAIIAAFVATFSLGGAIVIWIVGLIMLVAKKQAKSPIIIWLASAFFSVVAYYYKYKPFNPQTSLTVPSSQNLLEMGRYFSAMFGRPFTGDLNTAIIFGTLSLLLLVPCAVFVWRRHKYLDNYLPWLALMFFPLLIGFVITLGRVNNGLYSATSSRYTTFPIMYYVGLMGLIITFVDAAKAKKALIDIAILTLVLINVPLLYSSYRVGIYTSRLWAEQMRSVRACTHQAIVSDECLWRTNYTSYTRDTSLSREQLKYIKDKHWGGY